MKSNLDEPAKHVDKKVRIELYAIKYLQSSDRLTNLRDDFEKTVIVKVGVEKRPFTVHKGILCKAAPYFRAALEGGFKEAQNHELELSEDDPAVFKHFLLWSYTGEILSPDAELADISYRTLVDLHILGEMRGVPTLRNKVIDILIDKQAQKNVIATSQVQHVYDNTSPGCPLRRFFVDKVAYRALVSREDVFAEKFLGCYCTDYLIDLVCTLNAIKGGRIASTKNLKRSRSDYHVDISETTGEQPFADKEEVSK